VRLFVPTLRARDLDAATKEALTAKVLTAAQAHNARFAVISSRDLKAVLDVEAERMAAGCDDDGCTSEVAEALDAPQVLVATLDHVGDRWLLTIARADRVSVRVGSPTPAPSSPTAHATSWGSGPTTPLTSSRARPPSRPRSRCSRR
jgi:hypothetical protein